MGIDILSVRASTYASIFTFFSVIFTVIAFSTPYWLAHDGRSARRNFQNLGLWEACFDRFRDPNYQYDREFRGCKWLFDEDYSFMLNVLEPTVLQPPLPRHPFSHLQMAIGNSPSRSDARVSVLAVLALGAVATLIAFVSPNWLASDTRLYGAEFLKLGLWETCFRSFRGIDDTDFRKYFAGCRWIFREEYQSIRSFLMPAFFIVTQVLYTLGFVFLLFAVIGTLAIELCFITDREAFAMKVLSCVMFLSALFCTTAVIVFGIYGDDRDWMPDPEHNFLSWSFALAVVGCFCHWISAILFLVESRILYKREIKREQQSFSMEPTRGIKS